MPSLKEYLIKFCVVWFVSTLLIGACTSAGEGSGEGGLILGFMAAIVVLVGLQWME